MIRILYRFDSSNELCLVLIREIDSAGMWLTRPYCYTTMPMVLFVT